jgi:hypothetical protein
MGALCMGKGQSCRWGRLPNGYEVLVVMDAIGANERNHSHNLKPLRNMQVCKCLKALKLIGNEIEELQGEDG